MGSGNEPRLCPECEARKMDLLYEAWRKAEDEREKQRMTFTNPQIDPITQRKPQ